MIAALEFTAADWERTQRNWTAWWHGEIDRPMIVLEAMGDANYSLDTWNQHLTKHPLDAPADRIVEGLAPQLAQLQLFGDAFPKWFPNFGPGVVAAFLGSPVDASTGTTWFHPSGLTLAESRLGFAPDAAWWQRVKALTQAGIDCWGGRVVVAHTDLGGNLDILASLRGTQQLLLDLYDAPQEVERLLGQITTTWLRYYDAFSDLVAPTNHGTSCWAPIWAPGRCYMLQSDFSYMISPRMFEQLVMPDLIECCDELDYAFYHLDGKGQIKHLDMLLSIERLRGIQWIPGDGAPPPEEWLPLLKRIRDGGKLCQVYVTLDGALKIARELGGKGFAFCIPSGSYPSVDEAQAYCVALRAEGLLD
jgi:5-methyltetrahydrofolate--homocysteine methyltransferase